MQEPEHTARITLGGFVICACGWATAAVDDDPRELATRHVAETASPGTIPAWVERRGGTVCIPHHPGVEG